MGIFSGRSRDKSPTLGLGLIWCYFVQYIMFLGKIPTLDTKCVNRLFLRTRLIVFSSLYALSKELYAFHIVEWITPYRLLMEADGFPFAMLIHSRVWCVWHIFNVCCVVNKKWTPPPLNAHKRSVNTTMTTLLNVNLVLAMDPADVICPAQWFHKPLGRPTREYNYEMRMGFSHTSINTFFRTNKNSGQYLINLSQEQWTTESTLARKILLINGYVIIIYDSEEGKEKALASE